MFEEAPLDWEEETNKFNAHVATATRTVYQEQTQNFIKRFGHDAVRLIKAGEDMDADKASLVSHTCAQIAWILLYMPDITRMRAYHFINLAKAFTDENTFMWAHLRFVESKVLIQTHKHLTEALIAAQEASRYFLDNESKVSYEVIVHAHHQCALAALELNLDSVAQEALNLAWRRLHTHLSRATPPTQDDTSEIHALIALQGNIHENNFLALAERYNQLKRWGQTQSCLSEMKRYPPLSTHPLDVARRNIIEGEMLIACRQYDLASACFTEAYQLHHAHHVLNTPQYIRVLLGLLTLEQRVEMPLSYVDELKTCLEILGFEPDHHYRKQLDDILYYEACNAIRQLR